MAELESYFPAETVRPFMMSLHFGGLLGWNSHTGQKLKSLHQPCWH
jgi:hypothetical protein